MKKTIFCLFSIYYSVLGAAQFDNTAAGDPEAYNYDLLTIEVCENGLKTLIQYINSNDSTFGFTGSNKPQILSQEQKQELLSIWTSLLDYFAQLDYVKVKYRNYYAVNSDEIIPERFLCYYLAFLTQYRYALKFLDIVEKNGAIHTILNESQRELGLPKNTYRQFKFHFLNIVIATQFVAYNLIYQESVKPDYPLFDRKINADVKYIYQMGQGRGIELTFANAFKIITDTAFYLWFPIQKEVSVWMGDTKVRRKHHSLISQEDIRTIIPELKPGDILFQRREWYLTNVGLPGYWTHSALFIGTPAERNQYFQDNEDVISWVRAQGIESGNFEELLQFNYPEAYTRSTTVQKGNLPRILEAIAEGVVFTSMEESASCDALAALRPRLSEKEKAIAIYRAFQYSGRPYDFNFDFLTDSSLVCTELLFKAFQPDQNYHGLTFRTKEVGGRLLTPANEIVRQFVKNYNKPQQQMDFILFYDGNEKKGYAKSASLRKFKKSWKRPDWHIIIQNLK